MNTTSDPDEQARKKSSLSKKAGQCWNALVIAGHLLARRKTVPADQFTETITPDIEKHLAIANSAIRSIEKSMENCRKKQTSRELEEQASTIADLIDMREEFLRRLSVWEME